MMSSGFNKQLSTRLLIMYVISAVLFLTSIELHIHARDVAAPAEHSGYAVHISSLAGELMSTDANDEIKLSPDGVLKYSQNSLSILAVFLFAAIVAVSCYLACTGRLRDGRSLLPERPFHGTPSVRAPPR